MKRKQDDIERICAHCEQAIVVKESDICICKLIGAVSATDNCRHFKLDLLKLAPVPKPMPDEDTIFM
ncbi:MAG: hypothetical protein IKU23_03545 [Clostridia bacterium]|jgi:hypothetical protein|nr:hypothetical protein [Clostridia bacterium]MBR5278320.1 hypothetical protein [Clostridia bacterium]